MIKFSEISKIMGAYKDALDNSQNRYEDLFQQTFKSRKGDWLVMSHEALGIQGKPIPINVENAEEKIRNFLDKPHGTYALNDLNLG